MYVHHLRSATESDGFIIGLREIDLTPERTATTAFEGRFRRQLITVYKLSVQYSYSRPE